MRHQKSGRKLNRNSAHRKAMFRNMANSLFEHEIIKTTVPKAKELRRVAEPLITLAKEDSVAHRRQVGAPQRLAVGHLRQPPLLQRVAARFLGRQRLLCVLQQSCLLVAL